MPGMFDWGGRPKGKSVKPPELPPVVASPSEISEQAMGAGEAERKRIRGRKFKTIFAGGRGLAPVVTSEAKLKTVMG